MQPDRGSIPSTPRWVKVFGIIAIVLALLVLFVVLSGAGRPHGPGRHMPPGDAGGHTRWELLILFGILAVAAMALNWRPPWVWLARTARDWPLIAMAPRLRKLALTAHVASSVGSLGAVAGFLALAVAGVTSQDAQLVRAAYVAMELTARFVTTWGLFRHYWVLVKLLLNVFVVIVLLLQMEPTSYMADVAAETTLFSADLFGLRRSLVMHAAGGLLVLLVATVLGVYKPRGTTPYGARKELVER